MSPSNGVQDHGVEVAILRICAIGTNEFHVLGKAPHSVTLGRTMGLARIGLDAPRNLVQSRCIRQVTIYWPFIFSPNTTTTYHYQTVLLRLWFASSFKFFDHGRIEFQGPWHRQHWKTSRPWDFWDPWHLGSWSCTQGSHSQASRFQRIQSIRYLSFAHPCRSPYPSTYMPGYSWAASTWSYHDLWVKGLQGFKCNIICYDSLQQKANHRPQGRMQ